ncbi:MAG: amino-acid racemase [Chloroflexota bacterium]|nr:amino-acid racemase [Chloroflexota bacterium]
MKRIGLIGGMSWESSAEYYRLINEEVKARLGGLHSADCVMLSVDFDEIEVLQREARWVEAGQRMAAAGRDLQAAGADCVLLCTNTMHKVADAIQAVLTIPFIHIADPTAEAIKAAGLDTIGLLGTRFTMEEDFYTGRLERVHGLKVLLPEKDECELVHCVIYDELVLGILRDESRAEYVRIMQDLVARGAQGIILGCTEIGLLVSAPDSTVPLFDTTRLHALAGVAAALV